MNFIKPADCKRCLDVGVCELTQGKIKTLANCFCDQGKKQMWKLPTSPMRGFESQPVDWREFKPKEGKTQPEITLWWRERIRNAQEFWAHQEVSA